MSDPRILSPDDDGLSGWIVQHPEVWGAAVEPLTPEVLDVAVRQITSRQRSADRAVAFSRKRRRRLVGGALTVVLVTGGAVGVAALLRSGQPSRANEGIACRASADVRADAIVIDFQQDAVAGCAALWSQGRFAAPGAQPEIPELTACIAAPGDIEVFPGDQSVCERLGLTAADSTLDPENAAIVALNDRLVSEVNLADCAPTSHVQDAVTRIVAESGLKGWTVTIRPDSNTASCAKVAIDAPSRTITIVKFP